MATPWSLAARVVIFSRRCPQRDVRACGRRPAHGWRLSLPFGFGVCLNLASGDQPGDLRPALGTKLDVYRDTRAIAYLMIRVYWQRPPFGHVSSD